jgi:hypothetical protein
MQYLKAMSCLVCVLLVVAIMSFAHAAVVNIPPTDDAYVNDTYPTTAFGSTQYWELYVGDQNWNDPIQICRSYLMFDLHAHLPECAVIDTAKLWIYLWGVGPEPDIVVGAYSTATDWDELTVTWNTKPVMSATPTDVQTIGGLTPHERCWYVTSDVEYVWEFGADYSAGLAETVEIPKDHNWIGFCSKEDEYPQFRPYLQVFYSLGPSPTHHPTWGNIKDLFK